MIDSEGFRANVGIIIINDSRQVLWARRQGSDAWQFPQGGIKKNESAETAMYRELKEEIGLEPDHVELLKFTDDWLRYRLPEKYIRKGTEPLCIGQKQIWYLLRLIVDEKHLDLTKMEEPEFDLWKWVDFWRPIDEIIFFKREVYEQALKQLEPYVT
tara:strand:+ start:345 stop:815 length:471 start_codon:yes stop_codon:yes gene_type:complete